MASINKTKERKRADLIFNAWKADLSDKDRSFQSLLSNFDELFENFKYSDISIDTAEEYLKEAIIAHLPSKYIVKKTYQRFKKNNNVSEIDFFEDWKRGIEDKAKQAFFFRYPVTETEKTSNGGSSLSKDEYIKQRRYAESFPRLDLSNIADVLDDDDDVSFSMADLGD